MIVILLIISTFLNIMFIIRINQLIDKVHHIERNRDYFKEEYEYCWNYIHNEKLSYEEKVELIKARMEEIPF